MRTYYKLLLAPFSFGILCLIDVLCTKYSIGTVLNPAWFTIAIVGYCLCAGLAALITLLTIAMDNDEKDKNNFANDFGWKTISSVTIVPFALLTVYFIQMGEIIPGVASSILLLMTIVVRSRQNSIIQEFLEREAREGTKTS
ncbi:hypothetical protein ABV23_RS00935 [Escherichia coli]|nr:hypothetical protein [Escherichia coli]